MYRHFSTDILVLCCRRFFELRKLEILLIRVGFEFIEELKKHTIQLKYRFHFMYTNTQWRRFDKYINFLKDENKKNVLFFWVFLLEISNCDERKYAEKKKILFVRSFREYVFFVFFLFFYGIAGATSGELNMNYGY